MSKNEDWRTMYEREAAEREASERTGKPAVQSVAEFLAGLFFLGVYLAAWGAVIVFIVWVALQLLGVK